MILSVLWDMFNGLEHTAILSHFLTFVTKITLAFEDDGPTHHH
jgi:hypothetical protein